MGLEEELLKIGRRLERRFSEANTDHILELLKELQAFEVTVPLLRSTRIGVTVNKIKKKSDERKVTELAKAIIKDWKKILESSYKDKGTKATADLVKPTQSDSVRISSPAFKNLHLERPSQGPASHQPSHIHEAIHKEPKLKRSYSADIQPFIQTEKKKERSHSTTIQPSLHIVKKRERTHSTSDKSSFHATKKPERNHSTDDKSLCHTSKKPESLLLFCRSHSTDVQSSLHTAKKPERNHSTDDKSLCHTSKKPERSHSTDVQSPLDAAKKTERNHCSDAQTSVQTTKKPERRHSLSSPLPSPTSCKSPTNTKEESRKPSASSPVQPTRNGSTKPITDAGKEGASGGQMGSPADVHSQSPCLLSPCYLTGDPVRDKCVDMVASALKTDDDYKQFGTNCERLAWEIEECIYRDIKATDMKYRNRIRSRISNLKDPKNPNLRKNVLCGVVTPQNIATMTAEEMASDELRELRNTMTQEAIREHQMAKTGGTTTDLLQCEKCKKKNCTYNQVQTRSADEPMTTFVLCNECGNRWKFC
ncbi:transcription elongation factor A protein 3 isoform X3 [Xenopus tropicalis]|uniref:Transcription elongation factor A protein 3 isoform X3 n=1 Tax=Xenopus tropicalis TaxID=8364 RepID=A0A8J0QW18_XENTR|nr:transcription elongation factor A protein 3 isoform X3 [Xenopus tropicalis]|eukprot:XP_002939405.2 PREDICTED: transcription elongation factor A protein 3 isoform X3 [Xenopus tropicalis]